MDNQAARNQMIARLNAINELIAKAGDMEISQLSALHMEACHLEEALGIDNTELS